MSAASPDSFVAASFTVNGRGYRLPARPVVVVCIGGCADEYVDHAIQRGRAPNLARITERGFRGLVRGALPSLSIVNNASIVTGVPPSQHGVSGGLHLDPDSGEAVMMGGARFLRGETILAAAARAGRRVAVVSATDPLRTLLSNDLGAIAFSSERAAELDLSEFGIADVQGLVGRPAPPIDCGDASVWAVEAGATLLEAGHADFLYVTLSDHVQHQHPPTDLEALDFYAGVDAAIGRYIACDAVVGITADHGMSGKTDDDGRPKVVWVESVLRERFGAGARVVCTITDPGVVHQGGLGGFVNVHLAADGPAAGDVARCLRDVDGILEVWPREQGARALQLPVDRIGDLLVLGDRNTVLGRTPGDHDRAQLEGLPLRSHGSRYEELVPLLCSERLPPSRRAWANADPRNFDVYSLVCPAADGQGAAS